MSTLARFAVRTAVTVAGLFALALGSTPSTPQTSMPQKIRIVALGDSTTAGTPAWKSPLEAPPRGRGDETSQYAYWLMQSHPEWEVLNRGVNGERSDQIAARFDRDVIEARPKAVVIIAGVNDVYQGRSVDYVTAELARMYALAASAGIPIVAGSIIPYNTATGDQNDRMHRINTWIREQSKPGSKTPVTFVDTRLAVASPGNQDRLVDSPDELHPSPRGYRLMADAIRTSLETILR
jgi:lysophospholipase L1-like esterase